jgi:tetratricopeptide (TPR) repeat protein
MGSRRSRVLFTSLLALGLLAGCKKDKATPADDPASGPAAKPSADPAGTPAAAAARIPVTTKSDEARALYGQANKLQLELRATDAHALYEQAAAKDPDFALAHVGLATTAPTNNDFFASLDRAVALAGNVSEPERLWIKGLEAGAKGDPEGQKAAYGKLVELLPSDPQARNLLGNHLFGRQDWAAAVEQFNKAIAADPKFTASYNQLGYAYRFLGKLDEAEQTFKKYIELIPNDPNPYDSYAELLMKRGKFDESIASYEKALAVDPNFIASHVGIGNNHMLAGRGDKARESFTKLGSVARNPGEKRQALFWTVVSYIHEGKQTEALAALDKEEAIAVEHKDLGLQAQDKNFRGTMLIEFGKPDAAAAEFKAELETIAKANVPDQVKEQTLRNGIYDQARVALAKKDLATAKAKLAEYGTAVDAKKVPFEVRQHHELAGMVAIEEKRFADAITELGKANQQDPKVLYLLGVAHAGAGDAAKARESYQAAHDFNGLAANLAFVRAKAKQALAAK